MEIIIALGVMVSALVFICSLPLLIFWWSRKKAKIFAKISASFFGIFTIALLVAGFKKDASTEGANEPSFSSVDHMRSGNALELNTPLELTHYQRREGEQSKAETERRQAREAELKAETERATVAARIAEAEQVAAMKAAADLREAQAATLAKRLLAPACRAIVSIDMGRDPEIMRVVQHPEGVELSYRRPGESKTWHYVCRLASTLEGHFTVDWATLRDDRTVGRWRTDYRYDRKFHLREHGQDLVVEHNTPNQNVQITRFPLARLHRGPR